MNNGVYAGRVVFKQPCEVRDDESVSQGFDLIDLADDARVEGPARLDAIDSVLHQLCSLCIESFQRFAKFCIENLLRAMPSTDVAGMAGSRR